MMLGVTQADGQPRRPSWRRYCLLPTAAASCIPPGMTRAPDRSQALSLGRPHLSLLPAFPMGATAGHYSEPRRGAATAIPVCSVLPSATRKKQTTQLQENNPSFCHNISISKTSFPSSSAG